MIAAIRAVAGVLALVVVWSAAHAPDGTTFRPVVHVALAAAVLLVVVPCLFDLPFDRAHRQARTAEKRATTAVADAAFWKAQALAEHDRWVVANAALRQLPTREPTTS